MDPVVKKIISSGPGSGSERGFLVSVNKKNTMSKDDLLFAGFHFVES